jgi:hypothetical protein
MILAAARRCKPETEDRASEKCSVLLRVDVSDAMLGAASCSQYVYDTSSEDVRAQVRIRNLCSWTVNFAKSQGLRKHLVTNWRYVRLPECDCTMVQIGGNRANTEHVYQTRKDYEFPLSRFLSCLFFRHLIHIPHSTPHSTLNTQTQRSTLKLNTQNSPPQLCALFLIMHTKLLLLITAICADFSYITDAYLLAAPVLEYNIPGGWREVDYDNNRH